MYLLRLDDASEYMDEEKWRKMESILNKYSVKPIIGVIPNNKDVELVTKYDFNPDFWSEVKEWEKNGWTIGLHGHTHVYSTNEGGINPVHQRSEFAGEPLKVQINKICNGLKIFNQNNIETKIFIAPSHTFDLNTLEALRQTSEIRVISDTISNDVYKFNDFHFIPQQAGNVRKLPFKVTTFCYHPNNMTQKSFEMLDEFLSKNSNKFTEFNKIELSNNKASLYDRILKRVYFIMRFIRRKIKK